MIVSDTPSCGITYAHHSDDSRGIIYDRNMFIVQATGNRKRNLLMHFLVLTIFVGTAIKNPDRKFLKNFLKTFLMAVGGGRHYHECGHIYVNIVC